MSQRKSSTTSQNNDRSANGRFAQGNRGGPGNPFARQSAALRQAILEAVTPEDIKGVFYVLVLKAQGGDLAAAKLLLHYTVGKPQPAVDPDTLDQQELEQRQAASVPLETLKDLSTRVPAETAVIFLQEVTPIVTERFVASLTDSAADDSAPAQSAPAREEIAAQPSSPARSATAKPRSPAAPSPNGVNGRRAERKQGTARTPAPSPNGVNGHRNGAHQRAASGRTRLQPA